MRPVPHREDLPTPHLPTHLTLENESEHEAATEVPNEEQDYATYERNASSCEPHLLTQGELNDLVRDLKLSKKQAELLGSRLRGWNLLQKDTKVCFFRSPNYREIVGELLVIPRYGVQYVPQDTFLGLPPGFLP